MYTLKEHIGEERVNTALRSYLNRWRDAGPPYPTSLDLYKELQAVTPDSMKYVLTDLFETITVWDVRLNAANAERTGAGEYRVTIDVQGKKLRSDSAGNESETQMNDLVEVGVYAGDDIDEPLGEPLYLQRHRIKSGQQTITVSVTRQPGRVGIDPKNKLIQRKRENNVVALKSLAAQRGGDSTAWKAEYRAPRRDSMRVRKGFQGL